ncbi:MAG TPA: hypothetical protein VJX47_12040 [Candidatus Sulfotelmatobacter sp.]|nr:hypothetical protein [Candidatus Sulfotelmatobacter sp.]
MFEKLRDKLDGRDALIRAMRASDWAKSAEIFVHSTVLFLQLPPGCEDGLDPSLSQEEFLSHIRAGATDLSEREQFTPLCGVRGPRKSLLLFTQQRLVQQFAHAYVRRVKRIMQFEVVGVQGRIALRLFDGVDSVVFNEGTKHECEVPAEEFSSLCHFHRNDASAGRSAMT